MRPRRRHVTTKENQQVAKKGARAFFFQPEMQTSEFYSPINEMVFYHITKCGMTSMLKFLNCKRVPMSRIPGTAPIICIVREPLSRFISGFLTLRRKGLRRIYRTRRLSPQFVRSFKKWPLESAFIRTVHEVCDRGPFDTHLQKMMDFLGPSATVQNKFAGRRDFDQVTDWVRLEDLDKFCLNMFQKSPIHHNQSSKTAVYKLQKLINVRSDLKKKLLDFYQQDLELYESVAFHNTSNAPVVTTISLEQSVVCT